MGSVTPLPLAYDYIADGHENPQVNWINDVKHVLGELVVQASFAVIQKDEWDDQRHGPFVVKAEI